VGQVVVDSPKSPLDILCPEVVSKGYKVTKTQVKTEDDSSTGLAVILSLRRKVAEVLVLSW
jgi:hypothetical protein